MGDKVNDFIEFEPFLIKEVCVYLSDFVLGLLKLSLEFGSPLGLEPASLSIKHLPDPHKHRIKVTNRLRNNTSC